MGGRQRIDKLPGGVNVRDIFVQNVRSLFKSEVINFKSIPGAVACIFVGTWSSNIEIVMD